MIPLLFDKEERKGAQEELKEDSMQSTKKSTSRQIIMQRILLENQDMPERVTTPESEKYAKVDMNVVEKVSKFGFPQTTIINSLRRNLANHCTTSYYLMLMDQAF